MEYRVIGTKHINGTMLVLSHTWTKRQYDALIERAGGTLPSGFECWDKKEKALYKNEPTVLGWFGVEPTKEAIEAMIIKLAEVENEIGKIYDLQ